MTDPTTAEAATIDRAALRDRIARLMATHDFDFEALEFATDAVLAMGVLPPAGQTALRNRTAEAALSAVETALGDTLLPAAREQALSGIAVLPATTDQTAVRNAVIAEVLPYWEAVYEPGNVSDYLIGYANDQDAATGMAEAWMRSQAEVTGRLEWVAEERLATGRYDRWFELVQRHADGIDTGPGIVVRRRMADEAQPAETEADFTDATTAFMQIFSTPALQGLRTELRIEGQEPLIGRYAGAGTRRAQHHEGLLLVEPTLVFQHPAAEVEEAHANGEHGLCGPKCGARQDGAV